MLTAFALTSQKKTELRPTPRPPSLHKTISTTALTQRHPDWQASLAALVPAEPKSLAVRTILRAEVLSTENLTTILRQNQDNNGHQASKTEIRELIPYLEEQRAVHHAKPLFCVGVC